MTYRPFNLSLYYLADCLLTELDLLKSGKDRFKLLNTIKMIPNYISQIESLNPFIDDLKINFQYIYSLAGNSDITEIK